MDDFMKFMSAIRDNNLDKTDSLYKSEFINMVDEYEETALHCACTFNNVNIVRFLLNKGWDIELEDKNKCRPLHIAIMNGRISIVNVLIKGECLLEEPNKFGYTPLDLANRIDRLDCIEILNDAITRNNLQPSMEGITNKSTIGQGHFRHVFKYYDSRIKKHFVMKELSRVSDNRNIDCFGNIIKMCTQKLCHTNIVRYYGVKKDEQCLHIFTEYLPGGSIKYLLNKEGPLTERHVGRYTKQILDGLSFLHDRNIIQRDIKCSSILRDIRDNVKINVLWSRQLEGTFTNDIDDKDDFTDAFYGIYCSAPEVIVGKRHTFSADVWSLGVAVVEMLTGKRPYPNLNVYEAMLKIASSGKVQYKFVNPISAELQSFINQTLSPDAKNRPSVKTLLKSDFIARYIKETGQEIMPVVTNDDDNQDLDTNQDFELISFGYNKDEYIGSGAFGKVYKGYDHKKKKDIAIKEVWLGSKDTICKNVIFLENEVATYKKIPNNNRIIKYYATYQDREFMNIIMEYMPGGSIRDELQQHLLTLAIVARYSKQILEGLACIHSIDIIHKDIKCANILKDLDGNVKLCDFGISRECIENANNNTYLGTVHWMAPECFKNERLNKSSDVWSFGITVLEMLTGNPPYFDTHTCWSFPYFLGHLKKYEYKCPIDIPAQLQSFLDLMLQCNKDDRANVDTLLMSEFINTKYD